MPPDLNRVRADFDEIAQAVDSGASGSDRFDGFLASLIPPHARRVLDVGCGLGRLTWAIAAADRRVVGVDLSPRMVERARAAGHSPRVSFLEGDFLDHVFDEASFDCVVSAAALHHMPHDAALSRMTRVLTPGGRLIVHDLRRNTSLTESLRAYGALTYHAFGAVARKERPFPPRRVRRMWARHGGSETYLSIGEARALARQCLPGASVLNHWLWRYTIVWDKPAVS